MGSIPITRSSYNIYVYNVSIYNIHVYSVYDTNYVMNKYSKTLINYSLNFIIFAFCSVINYVFFLFPLNCLSIYLLCVHKINIPITCILFFGIFDELLLNYPLGSLLTLYFFTAFLCSKFRTICHYQRFFTILGCIVYIALNLIVYFYIHN